MSDGRPFNEGGLVGPTHQRELRRLEIEREEAEKAAAAAEQPFEASDTAEPSADGVEGAPAAQEAGS